MCGSRDIARNDTLSKESMADNFVGRRAMLRIAGENPLNKLAHLMRHHAVSRKVVCVVPDAPE